MDRDDPAGRILRSERLLAMLPSKEYGEHLARIARAQKASAAARLIAGRVETDTASIVTDGIAADRPVEDIHADLCALLAKQDNAQKAATIISGEEDRAVSALSAFVNSEAYGMLDRLGEDLDALLDEGKVIIDALDGARDADAAIRADKADQWRGLLALQDRYIAIRDAHMALLRSSSGRHSFTTGAPILALAFFATPQAAFPGFADVITGAARVRTGAFDHHGIAGPAFDMTDAADLGHLIAVITRRNDLGVHVATADEASEAYRSLAREGRGQTVDAPGRPVAERRTA